MVKKITVYIGAGEIADFMSLIERKYGVEWMQKKGYFILTVAGEMVKLLLEDNWMYEEKPEIALDIQHEEAVSMAHEMHKIYRESEPEEDINDG